MTHGRKAALALDITDPGARDDERDEARKAARVFLQPFNIPNIDAANRVVVACSCHRAYR